MRVLSYILELCGWALIVFTCLWTGVSAAETMSYPPLGGSNFSTLDIIKRVGSLGSFLLDGVILGLIAILIARLARHPDAKALGQQAATMLKTSRTATGKDDE